MDKRFRIRFQTIEVGNYDIHLRTLRDNQQYSDKYDIPGEDPVSSAIWPHFGTVWESGKVLANYMIDYDIEGKRILEVGCGIGLASLVLNRRLANITATDYHPAAGSFLAENVKLNTGRVIPFIKADWKDTNDELGKFDLIIGSDVLYDKEHAIILAEFVQHHANKNCEVVMVDPGRKHVNKFTKNLKLVGFNYSTFGSNDVGDHDSDFKGKIHCFER